MLDKDNGVNSSLSFFIGDAMGSRPKVFSSNRLIDPNFFDGALRGMILTPVQKSDNCFAEDLTHQLFRYKFTVLLYASSLTVSFLQINLTSKDNLVAIILDSTLSHVIFNEDVITASLLTTDIGRIPISLSSTQIDPQIFQVWPPPTLKKYCLFYSSD